MYVMNLQMCIIGFLDLKNIGIDIKIMVIGALRAFLCAKNVFGGGRWSDVAIFEISISKTPPRTKFHASFRKCTTQAKIVTYPPHY